MSKDTSMQAYLDGVVGEDSGEVSTLVDSSRSVQEEESTTRRQNSSSTLMTRRNLQVSVVSETGAPLSSSPRKQQQRQRQRHEHRRPAALSTTPYSLDQQETPSAYSHRGLFSPFSPMLSRARRNPGNSSVVLWADEQPEQGPLPVSLSLCKKVSTMVVVQKEDEPTKESNRNKGSNNETKKLCVYPLWKESASSPSSPLQSPARSNHHNHPSSSANSTASGDSGISLSSVMSPTSHTLLQVPGGQSRELIMVNPTAFGKNLPGDVTVETAKLVAQVAHIDSEDWVRIYRFHQVLWPSQQQSSSSSHNTNTNTHEGLVTLVQSIVHDLMVPQDDNTAATTSAAASRMVIGMGNTCSTQTLFGRMVLVGPQQVARVLQEASSASTTEWTDEALLTRYGLLGLTASHILDRLSDTAAACTLSVLEVDQDDVLHDLLLESTDSASSSSSLRMQYTGEKRGAVVVGLEDVPVDSLQNLGHALRRALKRQRHRPRGHLLATLRVWHETDRKSGGGGGGGASFRAAHFCHLAAVDRENTSNPTTTRRNATIRRSISALGSVLRGELLREAGNPAMLPYRESTLTKVLQRWIDHENARVVMMGTISPFTDAYEETMGTLRYVSRLLHRPGHIPQSPFDAPGGSQNHHHNGNHHPFKPDFGSTPTSAAASVQSSTVSHHFVGKEDLLHQYMIADPRQRLSRLVQSAPRKVDTPESPATAPSVEPYVPTRYDMLQDNDDDKQGEEEEAEQTRSAESPPADHDPETPQRSRHHSEATMPTPIASNARPIVHATNNGSRRHEEGLLELDIDPTYLQHGDLYYDATITSPLTADTGTPHRNGSFDSNFALDASPTALDMVLEEEQQPLPPEESLDERDRYALALPSDDDMDDNKPSSYFTDDLVQANRTFDTDHDDNDDDDGELQQDEPSHATDQDALDQLSLELRLKTAPSTLLQGAEPHDLHDDDDHATRSTISSLTRPSPRAKLEPRVGAETKHQDSSDPMALLDRLSRESELVNRIFEASEDASNVENLAYSQPRVELKDGSVRSTEVDMASARSVLKEIDVLQSVMDQVKQTNNNVWSSSLQSIENLRNFHNSQQAVLMSLITERDKAENKAAAFQNELNNLLSSYRLELERLKEEREALRRKLLEAQSEQSETLKIADEAITTQEELEHKIAVLEQRLKEKESESVSRAAFEQMEREHASLSSKLRAAQEKLLSGDEQLQTSESELAETRISVASLESERTSLIATSSQLRREIENLRRNLEQAKSQGQDVSLLVEEIAALKSERQSLEAQQYERESALIQQLEERDLVTERYKSEATNAKREVSKVHEHYKSQLESYQTEISKHRDQVFQFEKESKTWRSTEHDFERRLAAEVRSKEMLGEELEQTREQLGRRVSDVKELSTTLKNVLVEKEEEHKRNERMSVALEKFQKETRSKVEKVVRHRDEAASLLEKTLRDNELLSKRNEELVGELRGAQRERDGFAEWIRTMSREGDDGGRRAVNRNDRGVAAARAAGGELTGRRSVAESADLHMRAEEIAAYMALNTRSTDTRQRRGTLGTLELKQSMYALEDMKEAEIDALKARVRSLESRLGDSRRRDPNDDW